jgi:hypothetical protein
MRRKEGLAYSGMCIGVWLVMRQSDKFADGVQLQLQVCASLLLYTALVARIGATPDLRMHMGRVCMCGL